MTTLKTRGGFTLIEIVMAFSILGVTALFMVGPLYQYGHRTDGIALAQVRNGVVAQQVGHLGVVPFDSLDARVGCTDITGAFPHTRCIRVAVVSATQKTVTLIVTPTSALLRPDTIVFVRTRPITGNPFNLP